MTGQEIVTILFYYKLQFIPIFNLNSNPELSIQVSSSFSFISVEIYKAEKLFSYITFEISDKEAKLEQFHCEDKTKEENYLTSIKSLHWPGWKNTNNIKLPYTPEILQSLHVADSIASLTVNCAAGDNYRPGNFSKIQIKEQHINLEQINQMNAKSLAHKNDFSLRKLVFTIPLNENTIKKRTDTFLIGNMSVFFSDNSSANNKNCGASVLKALKELSGK